jgi:hypothetical protein
MQYQSMIKGAPRPGNRVDTEYWALVNQLMHEGWYRIGQARDPSGSAWGFRAGHTAAGLGCDRSRGAKLPPRDDERWIVAKDETAAMRRLLRELKASSPRTSGPGLPLRRPTHRAG